jgi:hypothetical protein
MTHLLLRPVALLLCVGSALVAACGADSTEKRCFVATKEGPVEVECQPPDVWKELQDKRPAPDAGAGAGEDAQ